MNRKIFKIKFGFTLAEVLITLAIIGVVAALTVPILIANAQKNITVEKLKKTYSTLSNAIRLAEVDYGAHSGWDYYISNVTTDVNTFSSKYLLPYLNYTQYCTGANTAKCLYNFTFKNTYTYPDGVTPYPASSVTCLTGGNGVGGGAAGCNYIQLEDGTLIALQVRAFGGNGEGSAVDGGCIQFAIDLDGPMKGPNKMGHDFFDWIIFYKEHDFSYMPRYARASFVSTCTATNGQNCQNLIIYDGWKISSDYPW